MDDWFTNLYKAFIYVSAILFFIALNTTGNTTINASLSGYSTLTVGLLLIMTLILNGFTQSVKSTTSTFQVIMNMILIIGPFLFLFAIIASLMYLLITYKNIIIAGHVSSYYGTFSFISSILILVQMYLLYNGISNDKFQLTKQLSKITSSIICLTSVLNAICVLILYILLKYYTTDG